MTPTESKNHTSQAVTPIHTIYQKIARIASHTANSLGKKLSLEFNGNEVRVDSEIYESMSDTLVHLVRNAVDHGIEYPADRVSAGKSPTGKITISAAYGPKGLTLEIRDDGMGIAVPRIREVAIQKKMLPQNTAASDDEITGLIFRAGFSTRQEITEISGRGMGLDIVKSTIEKMGGRVGVQSEPGKGTCVRIRFPVAPGNSV